MRPVGTAPIATWRLDQVEIRDASTGESALRAALRSHSLTRSGTLRRSGTSFAPHLAPAPSSILEAPPAEGAFDLLPGAGAGTSGHPVSFAPLAGPS